MNIQTLTRFQAFGGHLFCSVCIAISSAALVFMLWYPGLVAPASGIRDILLILLLVDVVLGPVITLIIFDTRKKELKRDLAIIVVIQVVALLYGLHTVFAARPVYMVFNVDRFDLVYGNEIAESNLAKATAKEYQSLPLFGYKTIAARGPKDPKARQEILFASLSGGADLPQMPQYYIPYLEQKEDVLKRLQPLEALKEFNKEQVSAIDAMIRKFDGKKAEVGYLPLKAKVQDLTVIVSRKTGEVQELVDLKPWK